MKIFFIQARAGQTLQNIPKIQHIITLHYHLLTKIASINISLLFLYESDKAVISSAITGYLIFATLMKLETTVLAPNTLKKEIPANITEG